MSEKPKHSNVSSQEGKMDEQSFADPKRKDIVRNLLVAVDGSENSRRAVVYLADFFTGNRDVYIIMLSIISEPSEDYFSTNAERSKWVADKQSEMEKTLVEYKEILLSAGFQPEQLGTRLVTRQCDSIGDAILEERERLHCCLVVVGRRGLTHNQEFIFGSTSNRILHRAKNCAVMVVE